VPGVQGRIDIRQVKETIKDENDLGVVLPPSGKQQVEEVDRAEADFEAAGLFHLEHDLAKE
jgi:hypothetical protein